MSCVSSILFYGLSRVEENARVVAVVVRFIYGLCLNLYAALSLKRNYAINITISAVRLLYIAIYTE